MSGAQASEVLSASLRKNLALEVSDNNAPQKIIGEGFISVLLELLLELFEGCLSNDSKEAVAGRVKDPSRIQTLLLRTRIRRRMYNHSRSQYRREGGEHVLTACIKTAREANSTDTDELIKEVDVVVPNHELI